MQIFIMHKLKVGYMQYGHYGEAAFQPLQTTSCASGCISL